jgi:hypothetical protein
MTRDELHKLIDTIPDNRIGLFGIYEQSAIEAHVRQANAADARVEMLRKEHEAKIAELSAHVEALGGTEQAIALRKKAERERHLKQIEESTKALEEMGVQT